MEERGKFLPNMEYMVECREVRIADEIKSKSSDEESHEQSYRAKIEREHYVQVGIESQSSSNPA